MKKFSKFNFHMYTEMVFGKGTVDGLADLIKKYGGTKVLFVYGSGSIRASGLYDRVKRALDGGGLPFAELGGVKANPLRSFAEKGIDLARAEGADFFLGVGGGSAIDTAKAIAIAMANDGEYWAYYNGVEPPRMAPVGAINTIAAAGSETSGSTVLVDDIETGRKSGLMWPGVCRPVFAIMDPELTYTLPARQTAAGAADIFSHTFMRYFTNYASYLGDAYCVSTLRTVRKYAPVCLERPDDYEARAELMLAAAFSHNDLTGVGRAGDGKGGEHALERQISGYYDFPHGEGLAVMMPAYLKYMVRRGSAEQAARVADFGVRVFDVEPEMGDAAAVAADGIERFTVWLRSLGLPTTLAELGIPEGEYDTVAERCVEENGGLIKGFMNIDADGIREIFTLARG
ncbi:MAG: iron-containing alcohol dehydrogenase [Clostridiales Family XIII bacterium]|jgi:alcohol dehydrogenase YqhD (iron-dependent ADH family)|nr:iron-containing alcohol dehydrogenase [Clostridiales Family XIII bacterium]